MNQNDCEIRGAADATRVMKRITNEPLPINAIPDDDTLGRLSVAASLQFPYEAECRR